MLRFGAAGLCSVGLAGRVAAASSEVVVGRNGWLFPAFDQVTRVDFARLHDGASLIGSAVEILKQAGIKTVLCLTPAKSRIYAEYLPASIGFTKDTARRYAFELEELRRSGAVVPDVAEAMLAVRKAHPETQLFFKGDTHWTPDGAQCAAKLIAGAIEKNGMLPPSPTPGVRLRGVRDTRQSKNDLANLLPADVAVQYPLEAYKLPVEVESDGGDLLQEDKSDVVLVGNSYLHPSFGFSLYLSNDLNRPVQLVWKIHSFSPYWNLLDYLGSSAFKNARPKLLVWIFHETDLTIPPNNVAIWGSTAMKREAILDDLRHKLSA